MSRCCDDHVSNQCNEESTVISNSCHSIFRYPVTSSSKASLSRNFCEQPCKKILPIQYLITSVWCNFVHSCVCGLLCPILLCLSCNRLHVPVYCPNNCVVPSELGLPRWAISCKSDSVCMWWCRSSGQKQLSRWILRKKPRALSASFAPLGQKSSLKESIE